MKAWLIVLIVIGAVALASAAYFLLKGPDLRSYLVLAEPRIGHRPPERVLEVKFSGPAETEIKAAYGVLFKSYYSLKGAPKGPAMRPPKARYQLNLDLSVPAGKRLMDFQSGSWKGEVAIPIPESLIVTEQTPNAKGMLAEAATWEYGEVAEILHHGSYESEPTTIQKLEDFIMEKGYKAIGDHEEEYLKGPGMLFVSPKDYWTVIRYRIEAK
jgi:effector-binding domain-containing protein